MFNFKKIFNNIVNINIKAKLKKLCNIICCSSLLLLPASTSAQMLDINKLEKIPDISDQVPIQYMSNFICMEATAYSGDESGTITASGHNIYDIVGWGCAANDFSLGTQLYIECPSAPWINGTYTVLDTGGMGYGVIDIAMNNIDECYDFGRRTIYVTVLD